MCKEGWQRGGRGQKNISDYHLAKINGIKGELRLVAELPRAPKAPAGGAPYP